MSRREAARCITHQWHLLIIQAFMQALLFCIPRLYVTQLVGVSQSCVTKSGDSSTVLQTTTTCISLMKNTAMYLCGYSLHTLDDVAVLHTFSSRSDELNPFLFVLEWKM
jgi:hypothetical protein